MSKHNYTQYSNKNRNDQPKQNTQPRNNQQNKAVDKPVVKLDTTPVVMKETVETVSLPETVEGFVINCAKLNVRESASVNSGVVCVLNAASEIEVDVNKSTNDWVYVYTATGAEGYCMRQYIDARL